MKKASGNAQQCQSMCHSHLLQMLLQAFKRCRHLVGCPAPNANIIEYSTLNFPFNSKFKGRTPMTVCLFTFTLTHMHTHTKCLPLPI